MTRRAPIPVALVAVGLAVASWACSREPPFDPQSVPPPYREVAEIHHAKCGACHKRVEPGTRTRQKLEKALVKHRSRVRMTEEQWQLLVDYLAQAPAPPGP
ncbi:MAG TPA: hypothetical protein VLM85_09130 [Polyangiaceae bacterium]|nr:hypothetical protein [Polyangiaceae bacterium]